MMYSPITNYRQVAVNESTNGTVTIFTATRTTMISFEGIIDLNNGLIRLLEVDRYKLLAERDNSRTVTYGMQHLLAGDVVQYSAVGGGVGTAVGILHVYEID